MNNPVLRNISFVWRENKWNIDSSSQCFFLRIIVYFPRNDDVDCNGQPNNAINRLLLQDWAIR